MFRLIRFILIVNLVSVSLIYGFEKFTGFFGLKYFSDFAFFTVLLIWGIAALFFFYSPYSAGSGDTEEREVSSMVDTSAADEIDSHRTSDNNVLCVKLFLSGIPSFLACILG